LNQAEPLGVYGDLASLWRPASDDAACVPAGRRPLHSPDDDREEDQVPASRVGCRSRLVGLCPRPRVSSEEFIGGTAGVLEQRGRRRAPPLAILAPCARPPASRLERPCQTVATPDPDRTCLIQRFAGTQGVDGNRNTVHPRPRQRRPQAPPPLRAPASHGAAAFPPLPTSVSLLPARLHPWRCATRGPQRGFLLPR